MEPRNSAPHWRHRAAVLSSFTYKVSDLVSVENKRKWEKLLVFRVRLQKPKHPTQNWEKHKQKLYNKKLLKELWLVYNYFIDQLLKSFINHLENTATCCLTNSEPNLSYCELLVKGSLLPHRSAMLGVQIWFAVLCIFAVLFQSSLSQTCDDPGVGHKLKHVSLMELLCSLQV